MKWSQSIENLAAALSAFQGEVEDIVKSKIADVKTTKGGGFQYKYADLAGALGEVRPKLAKHGLSVTQCPAVDCGSVPNKRLSVETILMHSSGEFISNTLEMPVIDSGRMTEAQDIGATLSYARRYALLAILGLAQEDQDAQSDYDPTEVYSVIFNALRDSDVDGLTAYWDDEMDNSQKMGIWKDLKTNEKTTIRDMLAEGRLKRKQARNRRAREERDAGKAKDEVKSDQKTGGQT